MSVSFVRLRYAAAVREWGSMSAAARACEVSQPSLSEGVRQLEEELGVKIFERTSRGTRVTEEGRELLDQINEVLTEVDALEEMASAIHLGKLEGRFRLGVIATVGPYLLPRVLMDLERAHPQLDIEIREGLTEGLLEDVQEHRLDAAVIALPFDIPDDLETVHAYDETFFAAVPPGDPLEDQQSIALNDVDAGDLLLLDEGHCLRDHALEACKAPPSELRRQFRATSLETIREFVRAGWGISLFPSLAVRFNDEVSIRPLEPPASREIVLVTRRSSARRDSVEEMASFLGDAVEDEANGQRVREWLEAQSNNAT